MIYTNIYNGLNSHLHEGHKKHFTELCTYAPPLNFKYVQQKNNMIYCGVYVDLAGHGSRAV
jgi:hypothetical protein